MDYGRCFFFTCAAVTTAAGVLAVVAGIGSMAAPFDFINYCYLTIFGLLMLLVDAPVDNATV